jgi:hypothetical protein
MEQQSNTNNQKHVRLSSWKQLLVVATILLSGGFLPVVTSGQVAYASSYTQTHSQCHNNSSCNHHKKRHKSRSTSQQQQNQNNRTHQANTTGSNANTTGSTGNTIGANAPTAGGQGGPNTFGANAPTVGGGANSKTFGAFAPTVSGKENQVKQSNQINTFICLGHHKSSRQLHDNLNNFKKGKARKSGQQQKQQQGNITFICL